MHYRQGHDEEGGMDVADRLDWYVEWWHDSRFFGKHHKLSNLTRKEARRVFSLMWRMRASRAVLGSPRGIEREKVRRKKHGKAEE